jgi:hypothetical protein
VIKRAPQGAFFIRGKGQWLDLEHSLKKPALYEPKKTAYADESAFGGLLEY